MKTTIRTVLAIESSCDETACAIIRDGREVLANIIASQADLHAQFGGVVPEVAARSHIEVIIPVIEEALETAHLSWDEIDAIAVTRGPGLIGSLLIGTLTAQVLALEKNKLLIGVNHILAHAFASFLLTGEQPRFPILALIVSGGDSRLMLFQEDLSFELLGQTRDDAAGEAFDKVAKLIGLPYPGGPNISRAAESGNDQAYRFPIAKLGPDSLEFSFSGLKTAVLRQVQEIIGDQPGLSDLRKSYHLPDQVVADIAASFERTVSETLVTGLMRAYDRFTPKSVVIGGGVSANKRLRDSILKAIPEAYIVPPVFCTDNAAMIGALAYQMAQRELSLTELTLVADSSLEVL
ncbi:tRNA (adenosine(37)-N6)-threonylcarbamoyltransferase complex transferase subunit TsaD [Candidatus Saccharibacteria bacterium]|nr:tRNA (adenosine(37)-N6)-threonylcarbamoyltransferase complex transferase subunit TsaD [Candidatus Saccharibacteria bacterium]